jgi:hypothetical protein
LGWFFVAGFFACAVGQLFVALRDCFSTFAMTVNRNGAMCCICGGAKIVTQKTTEVWRAEQPKRLRLFLKTPLYQNCTFVFKKIWVLGCGELYG